MKNFFKINFAIMILLFTTIPSKFVLIAIIPVLILTAALTEKELI